MSLLAKPHDSLFRLLVADPGRAAVLLSDYLPPEVTKRLDPHYPPEHIEGTAIDGEGRATQADAIFRVRMKDGNSARIYVLLEHKSQPDAPPCNCGGTSCGSGSRTSRAGSGHPGGCR